MPPTPAVGTMMHGNIIFKGSAMGSWSENYWVACTGSGDFKILAENAFGLLVENRIRFLPTDVSIINIRTSEELVKNATKIATPPAYNMGPGQTLGLTEPINFGWIGVSSAEGSYTKSAIDHRAWVAADLNYVAAAGNRVAPPDRVANWGARQKQILTQPYSLSGGSARFVIPSYVKPTLLSGPTPWISITQPSPTKIQLGIPTSEKAKFLVGQPVAIKVERQKCIAGLNGRGKLLKMTDLGGGVTSLTVRKKVCCPPDSFEDLPGTVYAIVQAFYPIVAWQITEQAARRVGRDFFLPRGRRRPQCC